MKALRLTACTVGLLALALLAGGTPQRDIYITVALEGEPPPPDTVLARGRGVMPSNVAPGQQAVPALALVLTRRSSFCDQPLYLTGLRFTIASLDGAPIDPYSVISQAEVRIGDRSTPVETRAPGSEKQAAERRGPRGEYGGPALTGGQTDGTPPGGAEAAPLLDLSLSEPALISLLEDLDVEILLDVAPSAREPGFTITMDERNILLSHGGCSVPVLRTHLGDGPWPITARTTIIPGSVSGSFTNFPNPFAAGREATTFTFFLLRDAEVDLRVYTGFGELVKTLESGGQRSGGRVHEDIRWDGRDDWGAVLQNGTYFAVLVVRYDDEASERFVRKVAVLR